MNKKLKILLIVAAVIAVGAVTFLLLSGRGDTRPAPTSSPSVSPSPSPTADPLAKDRALLTRLSAEFAVKYRSFDRVDKAYVDSIRPYMTKEAFEDYRGTLRYADRAPFLQPVKSKALDTEVAGNSAEGKATAEVRLSSTDLRTNEDFGQTLRIAWMRSGERWSVTKVSALEFDKEQ